MSSVHRSRNRFALALVVAWVGLLVCQVAAGPRLAAVDGHAALRAVAVVQAVEPAEDTADTDALDLDPIVTALVTLFPHAAIDVTSASPRPALATAVAWLQRDLVRSTRLRC